MQCCFFQSDFSHKRNLNLDIRPVGTLKEELHHWVAELGRFQDAVCLPVLVVWFRQGNRKFRLGKNVVQESLRGNFMFYLE